MRLFTIFLSFLLAPNFTFGQTEKIDYILQSGASLVEKIDIKEVDNTIFLNTKFGTPIIENPEELIKVHDLVILKIELVYTTYKSMPSFDQLALNRKRLESLNALNGKILNNEMIEWEVVGQSSCASRKEGEDFFHGFIITFRPAPTKTSIEKEMKYIDKITSGESSGHHSEEDSDSKVFTILKEMPAFPGGDEKLGEYWMKTIKYPPEAREKGIQGTVIISFIIDENGKVTSVRPFRGIGAGCEEAAIKATKAMPKWTPGKYNGKPVKTALTLPIRFFISETYAMAEPIIYESEINAFEESVDSSYLFTSEIKYKTPDSTIFKVFHRNTHWKKMHVICDVTGSMSPYSAQLLLWYKLNFKANKDRIEYFTFFNDGNQKPDKQKRIGKTGGIYQSKKSGFEGIKDLAKKTMRNGYGGDIPENNIEALLKAIDQCEHCKDIVMIADNYATPRDLELLRKVKKPIRVIACGTTGGINTAYLDIAKQTKGSFHTMEEDLMNLAELNEGEEITIGKKRYIIAKGKFVPSLKL
ncbi:MAG: energy transducer TonB [Bacteroidota bacterium]